MTSRDLSSWRSVESNEASVFGSTAKEDHDDGQYVETVPRSALSSMLHSDMFGDRSEHHRGQWARKKPKSTGSTSENDHL